MDENEWKKSHRKQFGKLLMIGGLLGIVYIIIEPLFVTSGCFGRSILDVLIYILPVIMLIFGYKLYSRNE